MKGILAASVFALTLVACASAQKTDLVLGVGLAYDPSNGSLLDAQILGTSPSLEKCRAVGAQVLKEHPAGPGVKIACASVEFQN